MTIESICKSISNTFDKVRKPFPPIPKVLLLCSINKRPGLSPILSTAKVAKTLSKLGIPTEPMPDGSPNRTVAYTYAILSEVFRAIREDAKIQIVVQPGSPKIVVNGGYGTDISGGEGVGIMV